MTHQFVGDTCISLVFGEEISTACSQQVLAAYEFLKKSPLQSQLELLDVVPTYRSLAVHVEPGRDLEDLAARLTDGLSLPLRNAAPGAQAAPHQVEIPVVYDGPDLERIARLHGLQVAQVIALHAAGSYRVAMVGFKPHFPYLIGLAPQLETPRLESPRNKVPAGSVAIGGAQTGIYPEDSPGGWNIVGRTDPELLKAIQPGDAIRFVQKESL